MKDFGMSILKLKTYNYERKKEEISCFDLAQSNLARTVCQIQKVFM